MPWCPECRQEYMATVKRCADCGAELVESLDQVEDREAAKAAAARVVRLVAPPALADGVAKWLAQARVPSRPAEGPEEGWIVPADLADQVELALGRMAEVERDGDVLRVVGARTPEPALPADPSIVRRSIEELAADPAGLVPKLLALFAEPTPRSWRWAYQRLLELEGRGVVTLAQDALWLIRGGYRSALFGFAKVLVEARPAGLARAVAAELRTLDERALQLALHLLAQLGDRESIDAVVPFLSHDDPEVRAEADEVLMSATGFDAQFDAEAEPREREQAIRRWRDWIAKHARA